MNKRDTFVATVLLFGISFAVSFKLAQLFLSYLFSDLSSEHPYVIYAFAGLGAAIVAITIVRHFFPQFGRSGSI